MLNRYENAKIGKYEIMKGLDSAPPSGVDDDDDSDDDDVRSVVDVMVWDCMNGGRFRFAVVVFFFFFQTFRKKNSMRDSDLMFKR